MILDATFFDNVRLEIRQPKRKDLVNYRGFHETMEWNHVENLNFDRFHILHGITPDGGPRKE